MLEENAEKTNAEGCWTSKNVNLACFWFWVEIAPDGSDGLLESGAGEIVSFESRIPETSIQKSTLGNVTPPSQPHHD